MIKFAYTILYVQDVNRSVDFYEKAFGLTRKFVHESNEYAEMETGATTLSFATNELAQSNFSNGFMLNDRANPPAGIEIAFAVDDVPAVFAQAIAVGAMSVAAPKVKPWGQTVAYVRDLDGVLIEICSPMA